MAGLIAAALIAVMPGEFLGRSILGSTDQHVLEVLLSTSAMMFLLMAVKHKRVRYGFLAVAIFGLYFLTWTGALLFVLITGIYLAWLAVARGNRVWPGNWKHLIEIVALAGVSIWIFPSTVKSGFFVFYPSGAGLTTAEMQPILSPGGNFTLAAIIANFGLSFFISLVAIFLMLILCCKRRDVALMDGQGTALEGVKATNYRLHPVYGLILAWSIVILAAMLGQRRFAYYFAVNAAILTGFLLTWLAQHNQKHIVLVLIAVTFLSFGNASYRAFTTPPDWQEAMTWLRINTPEPYGDEGYYYQLVNEPSVPDYTVLSWWDYGYWITRIAHRIPNVNPSQDAALQKQVASILLSRNDTEATSELLRLKTRYIIIDSQMVHEKFWAIALWAGENITENSPEYHKTLMVRLYNTSKAEGIKLVHAANSVKIFELVGR